MPSNRLLTALVVVLIALSLAQLGVILAMRQEVEEIGERVESLEGRRPVVGIAPVSRTDQVSDALEGHSYPRPGDGASPATAGPPGRSGGVTEGPEDGDPLASTGDAASTARSRADTLAANHPDGAPLTEEQITKIVEAKVGEKSKQRWMDDGKLKPPMNEYAKELGLTSSQEAAFLRTVDDGKKLVFDLLKIPRPDGTSLANDFVTAFKEGAKDPAAGWQKGAEVWGKLVTDKVPGRDTTYLAEVLTLQKDMKSEFERTLTPEQMQRHSQSGVDPLDIKTGYQPFEEYLAEELAK